MGKRKIILTNWNPEDPVVYSSDLGYKNQPVLMPERIIRRKFWNIFVNMHFQ